jgi:hypothetical protein
MSYDRFITTTRNNCEKQASHADIPNGVSRDDASKEVTMPADVAVTRPGAGPGFYPRPQVVGLSLQDGVLNRESDCDAPGFYLAIIVGQLY